MAKDKEDLVVEKLQEKVANLESANAACENRILELEGRLDEMEKNAKPVSITTIDPNVNFQDCLRAATEAILKSRSIAQATANERHMEATVSQIVNLAGAIHNGVCNHFAINK
jgi:hypothetical protein